MSHIKEDVLDQYAMGTLSGESVVEVEEHLLGCGLCQTRLVQADEFLALFSEAATYPDAQRPSLLARIVPFRTGFWAGAATLAALAVFSFVSAPPRGRIETEKPTTVLMEALRGPGSEPRVASGKSVLLLFDLTVPSPAARYEIEAVDTEGHPVLDTQADVRDDRVAGMFPKPARGSYWIRVYRTDSTRELLAEYGLDVE